MKTLLKIAAATMLVTGTAAYAGPDANNAGAGAAETSGSQPAASKKAKPKKYCLTIEPSTGSRLSKRECLTKAEWLDMGVELDGTR
jgi:hypothetical protein